MLLGAVEGRGRSRRGRVGYRGRVVFTWILSRKSGEGTQTQQSNRNGNSFGEYRGE